MRPLLIIAVLALACGKQEEKAPEPPTAPAPTPPAAKPAEPPPPAAEAVRPEPAAPAAACVTDGEWAVAITLEGPEPPPAEKCQPPPREIKFTVAGDKVKVLSPKGWHVELEKAEGCGLKVSANGPLKGGVGAGVGVTLEAAGDAFAGTKGSWAEDEGACPRDVSAKATRKAAP